LILDASSPVKWESFISTRRLAARLLGRSPLIRVVGSVGNPRGLSKRLWEAAVPLSTGAAVSMALRPLG
jgi:hypothetical protein